MKTSSGILNDSIYNPIYEFTHNAAGIIILVSVGIIVCFIVTGLIIKQIQKKKKTSGKKDGESAEC